MKDKNEKKIFISYRVQDTSGETGRLVDALKQYFTDDQLFMDIENLEPGMDFTEGIEKSLSTCDVFLAVIGPNWAGERPGASSRLNDPDDWVRTEVGTALRRNIRVVPVLVDGGALPKAEDLPEDLLPLLKRQAIDVSNKRWRYDTEQLVRFLVNTIGIQPKRTILQRTASKPKPARTWLYVSGGVALAVVIMGIIGYQMEKEGSTGGGQSTPQTILPQTTEPAKQGVISTSTETNVPANLTGTWDEVDEAEPSTFVLSQDGIRLQAHVQLTGQLVATGSGSIEGNSVELHVPVMGVATTLLATLSADGTTLSGTYTVPATGASEAVRLVRR